MRGLAEQMLLEAGADLGAKTRSKTSAATLILQLPTGNRILCQRFDAGVATNGVDPDEFGCRLTFNYEVLLTRFKRQQMGIIEDVLDHGNLSKVPFFDSVTPFISLFLST